MRPGCDLMRFSATCLVSLLQLFTGAVVPASFALNVICGGFKDVLGLVLDFVLQFSDLSASVDPLMILHVSLLCS